MNTDKKSGTTKAHATDYDIIVIGSGIGGLTSAALLAKAGKSVLVVEQHDRPGGYAHSFKRKHFVFDSGVHLTSGCGMEGYEGGQIIRKVLQTIGVYDQLEFIQVNPFAYADFPGIQVDLPYGIDAFVNKLAQLFPDQETGLRDFLKLCLSVSEQAAMADAILASKNSASIQNCLPLLLQYRQSTLADVWQKFIQNEQLQSIVACNWPYLGLPPNKVSFVYWATMMVGYLVDGAYYCKGGFQKLAECLVNGLNKHGGEIRYKSAVEKISVIDNQVCSIQLASGENIRAGKIISNADIKQTIFALIGADYFPKRYISRLNEMQPSLSIFVVYIATDLDLSAQKTRHEAFYYDHFNHERHYSNSTNGNLSWLSITVPTLIDSSIAPKGGHLVMLTTLAPFDLYPDWSVAKPEFTAKMLAFAEQKIPGLKDHILFMESGSPATMQRYTRNHQGSAYGWDATPAQSGANRLANKSPIDGLYFSGHWTSPGGGIYGVCYSGMRTALQLLANP
jgi:phytoene desaturase